jgi:hypothetical protein
MKILVACVGSRGDVQPYVALGAGLQQAGHKENGDAKPAKSFLSPGHKTRFWCETEA